MHVTSASGVLINYHGKAVVQLNPVTVLVCDIDEDAILGSDFIWGSRSVSLEVNALSKRNRLNHQRKLYVIDPKTEAEHQVLLQMY